jgi:hypothetical protein
MQPLKAIDAAAEAGPDSITVVVAPWAASRAVPLAEDPPKALPAPSDNGKKDDSNNVFDL